MPATGNQGRSVICARSALERSAYSAASRSAGIARRQSATAGGGGPSGQPSSAAACRARSWAGAGVR
ncbi:MAG: hypothetical protein L0K86_24940, partial [Actinomycetia bacterium]|nr:hypothetical protein [Actinomycetes bacterium]